MEDLPFLIGAVNDVIAVLDRFENNSYQRDLDLIVSKIEYLYRILVYLNIDSVATEAIARAYAVILNISRARRNEENHDNSGYSAPTASDGRRGRPAFQISREQLSYFVEQCFKVKDISAVSVRTVERRMSFFGLSISDTYSPIDDNELDEITSSASTEHPGIGIRMLQGYLRSKGHRVQRERVRLSLLRTDPVGVYQRWRHAIRRRQYNVKSPLALWHIDGNHKLIRWRIVVHGGVDGYSRIPIYLQASNNNTADTALAGFLKAVQEFGLPSRVRSDKGGENVNVSMYMLNHVRRGPGKGSMITGKSTHNQRIERLWRDVFEGCLFLFYDLFYRLERQNLLDQDNDAHLWCLHYVFLPIINSYLTTWKNAWIHHPLSTARIRTPMQLWIRGLQDVWGSNSNEDEIFLNEGNEYGIDWDGPLPEENGEMDNLVEVPDTACPFTEGQVSVLPRTDNMNHLDGVDTFQQILNLL